MITYKSTEDFEKMRKAGKVVSNIHYEIFNKTKSGMTLLDLDLIAKEIIEKSNVKPSFLGYRDFPAHICASPNDVIVHGIPNEYVISEGDIISVDVGVIFQGYHADAAFSFGVGEITEEEKNLLSKTKYALKEAIKLVKDGQKLGTIWNNFRKCSF